MNVEQSQPSYIYEPLASSSQQIVQSPRPGNLQPLTSDYLATNDQSQQSNICWPQASAHQPIAYQMAYQPQQSSMQQPIAGLPIMQHPIVPDPIMQQTQFNSCQLAMVQSKTIIHWQDIVDSQDEEMKSEVLVSEVSKESKNDDIKDMEYNLEA